MNSKPPVLILLRSPETIRRQYYDGITRAFPDLKVTLVDNVAKAELSHLADAEIIITHGPHLEQRAGFVLSNAPKLRWVQGIGTGVDNIADRRELRVRHPLRLEDARHHLPPRRGGEGVEMHRE